MNLTAGSRDRPGSAAASRGRFGALRAPAVSLLLFLVLWGAYGSMGWRLGRAYGFVEYDILVQLDTPRAIGDMAVPGASHYRTAVHPVFVLLVNPLGSKLAWYLNTAVGAAVVLNSLFGALAVLLSFRLFHRLGGSEVNALLLSALFGLTMSQMVFSTFPDTASLAACSLLVTHLLFLHSLRAKRLSLWPWIPATVFALGVTITNVAQTLICLSVVLLSRRDQKSYFARVAGLAFVAAAALAVAVLLALLQKRIYPSSDLFFLPVVLEETDYVSLSILSQPLKILGIVLKNFLLVNLVAPLPVLYDAGKSLPGVTFAPSWSFSATGWLGVVLVVGLLVYALIRLVRRGQRPEPFYLGVLLCLLFNMALHCFYGIAQDQMELFNYTANVTFLTVTLAGGWLLDKGRRATLLLALLLLSVGVNNTAVFRSIVELYSEPPAVRPEYPQVRIPDPYRP